VDVMVQQVAEGRNHTSAFRHVVVRPDEGGKPGVVVKGRPHPTKYVPVDEDVGVNEDKHVAGGAPRGLVPRPRWARPGRQLNDDDLLRWLVRCFDSGSNAAERGGAIRGRHDRREPQHGGHASPWPGRASP